MQKITPHLWFNNNAEDAINLYTSVFKNSKILEINRGGDGMLFTATISIEGQEVMFLNAGPQFQFNESFSFFVLCEDQQEIDEYWQKLTSDGGQESQCGWLKDKFGLSWQIVPRSLGELMGGSDPAASKRVMDALLKMVKLDISALERARAAA